MIGAVEGVSMDAAVATAPNQPVEGQSLAAKLAQVGRAWEKNAISPEPGMEAERLRHLLQFASETGMQEYGSAYNVDDVKTQINEIAEHMDWETLTPEVLADETIAHDYRLAKILLKNAYGDMNNDNYPGYASKAELAAAIAEAKSLLSVFQRQPQAV